MLAKLSRVKMLSSSTLQIQNITLKTDSKIINY